jgi:hypothetical protein
MERCKRVSDSYGKMCKQSRIPKKRLELERDKVIEEPLIPVLA